MKRSLLKRGTALLSTAAMLLTYADFSAIGSVFAEEETPALIPYDVNGDNIFDDSEKAYELTDADDLYWFAGEVNSGNNTINACLANNITLNEELLEDILTVNTDGTAEVNAGKKADEWTPAGSSNTAFSGIFDGKGYTISGLYINDSDAEYVGLFGTSVGVIRNVNIADSYILGLEFVGGISGGSIGLIADCSFEGYVTAADSVAGGICGFNYLGKIRNCSEKCTVTGYSEVGGICGNNMGGTISGCSDDESSSVYASYYAGGICGVNYEGSAVTKCTSAGEVYGNNYVGGVCGINQNDSNITECSYSGTVSAGNSDEGTYAGGICGGNFSTVEKCTNTGTVTAEGTDEEFFTFAGGICGGNTSVVTECVNEGTISGKAIKLAVGGICGYSYTDSTTEKCINKGTATAEDTGIEVYSGGICGGNDGYIAGCYNTGDVSGDVDYVGGVCGSNCGTITNCCYLADTDDGNGGKSAQQFANGEVCCLLNGGENQAEPPAFFQNLSEEFGGVDALPVLDSTHHAVKYDEDKYYNEHSYTDGVCTVCGGYVPANEVADVNDIDGDENTTETVYEISNAGQLYWFANEVNSGNKDINAYLANDITVNENLLSDIITVTEGYASVNTGKNVKTWTPVGVDSNRYEGTFDGKNHKISGLYFNTSYESFVGLFCRVSNGAIKNVKVDDSYFNGFCFVSGICAYGYEATIENCSFNGWAKGAQYTGGICAENNNGKITDCVNYAYVSGSNYVGGIAASNDLNSIKGCINEGTVTGSHSGGICGSSFEGTLADCTNKGSVSGKDYISGICAENISGAISECSNSGDVSGNEYVSGICGENKEGGSISECSNEGDISGNTIVGGVCGNSSGTITNCSNIGDVSGNTVVGGVCGSSSGTITNCSNIGDVSGDTVVGGVCGSSSGTIENCFNTGAAVPEDEWFNAGGVCGYNNDGTIINCYYLEAEDLYGVGYVDGESEGTAMMTDEQFKSGEAAYKLGSAFFQNLGEDDLPVLDSNHKTVYLGSPCPVYTNTEGEASEHSYHDGICEKCGAFKDGIGAKLTGYSLALDGSIGVNFYMQLSDELADDETAYMLFTLPDGNESKVYVSEADTETVGGTTYYIFKCTAAATEMSDTIKAQIITDNGNGTEYSYSVKEYADYILENADENEEYKKAEGLVKAMLSYGAYAQIFKGYNTENLPCVPDDVSEYSIDVHGFTAAKSDNVEFRGANLSMLSNTTLRMFFEIDDLTGVTITRGSENLEIGENNGLYFVEIKNITPDKLSDDFMVTVNDNGETFEVLYSPLAYCYQVYEESEDASLVNLVKAIALYNIAAKSYFTEVQ